MLNGICVLTVIPMRKTKSDKSEMINQILFGETFKIKKQEKKWSYVQLNHDKYEGWIDNKQYQVVKNLNTQYKISNKKHAKIKVNNINQSLILGSLIPINKKLKTRLHISEDLSFHTMQPFKNWFIKMAKKYLNVPYLWGGRTTIGIDCSGYTQMVFRFFNKQLPRDAYQQASVGEEIYDLKDVKLGDLAFFTSNKTITHVGIILRKNKIIHASGKVRIDRLDENGIYNTTSNNYTHKLKLIKRII
tara:strand:+ start:488 stop:1225 length:738 start_codon:yes stop_codon:yes gene_type:complete